MRVEEDLRDWLEYSEEGSKRALALGNRGPVKLDDNGNLDPLIIEAYQRAGFYVFTDVLSEEEIGELAFEFDALLDNAPTSRKGLHDKHGEIVKFLVTTLCHIQVRITLLIRKNRRKRE